MVRTYECALRTYERALLEASWPHWSRLSHSIAAVRRKRSHCTALIERAAPLRHRTRTPKTACSTDVLPRLYVYVYGALLQRRVVHCCNGAWCMLQRACCMRCSYRIATDEQDGLAAIDAHAVLTRCACCPRSARAQPALTTQPIGPLVDLLWRRSFLLSAFRCTHCCTHCCTRMPHTLLPPKRRSASARPSQRLCVSHGAHVCVLHGACAPVGAGA